MAARRADMTSSLTIMTIILLCMCSLPGILSMDFTQSFAVVNQYGHTVTIFGSGIYAGDSYFKAPISIGTDICVLFVVVPLFVAAYMRRAREDTTVNKLHLLALYATGLYYAASISLGVKYNQLLLVYIALLGCTLFGMFMMFRRIDIETTDCPLTRGLAVFLILTGIALIVAWLPDIIPTLTGRPLPLIGVYTTEITYVLDMGIVAPLCLVCLQMLRRRDPVGTAILAAILKLCIVSGVMVIPQTVCQYLSGTDVPLPALITKSATFAVLAIFAFHLERKLYARLSAQQQ